MAGRRLLSKRCIWLSRRPWRPATPNTKPDPCRTTRHLAERSGSRARRTRGRRSDGADSAHPAAETATIVDARWVTQTADHILAVMENSRSTWQMWHVRAEVQRQVRMADVPVERASGGGSAGR